MEFIKVGKNYMIKDSNGYMISEKQKEQYEKNLLNPEHKPCNCGKTKVNINTTIVSNTNEIKKQLKKIKSTSKKTEVQNDTIEEATTTEE